MEGLKKTAEEITANSSENSGENSSLKTNKNVEIHNNSNIDNSNEQSQLAENHAENNMLSDENSESDAELLEWIRALENKVTQQNQQIVSLAVALKMGKNESDGLLANLIIPTCQNLQSVSSFTKSLLEPCSMSEIYSRRPADFIWTIKDIKQKVKNEIFEMVSEEFQLSGYPNKAKAKLELTADGWLNASILIIDDGINREGTFKNLTVLPSFCYVLKSQYESKKYDIVRPVVYTFGSAKLDFTKFNYNQKAFLKLYLINATSLHNRNDAITVEFHVEPPTITRHVYSYNKILNWAIDQYAGKRKRARYSGQVFDCSPYIYSGGYRVQVHMLLNGLGDFHRQGITANVLFLTGENDERLPKSFLHRTTVTLIDQKHPGRNIVKSVEKDIKKTRNYIINLATFKEIDKMILKDILYYQVKVEPVAVVVPPVN